ncbi:hypothetical protein MXD81_09965, partial [Microbacteriaceae bacterium K1510]|nr:hypothetical protein [Microbacteriaceae bacterium K1510]
YPQTDLAFDRDCDQSTELAANVVSTIRHCTSDRAMPKPIAIDPVRASRAGHNFHEQWAARRSLQLIFPRDRLHAIAVEGISTTDPTDPGAEAEDIADLTLYYGHGDTFKSSERVETIQFKYRVGETPVSASYLKKTLQKFCTTILG